MLNNREMSYSVRKSAETLEKLEKENFNLKLKIYFLESKFGNSSGDFISYNDEIDLVLQNECLNKEIQEKNEIMLNALNVIEMLEKQKSIPNKKKSTLQVNIQLISLST